MSDEMPDSSEPAAIETEPSPRTAHAVAGVGSRWRSVLVYALAVLTCLSILTATVGVWAHRTLLNTDSWVNAVGPLADNPTVTDAVAKEVTTQLLTVIDAQQVAANALPDKAKVLAAPLTDAVGQFVERTVAEMLRTDQFKTFWVEANRRVHSLAVKVLRGDTKAVKTDNGTVQLNLLPLIGDALRFIQQKAPGLFGSAAHHPRHHLRHPGDRGPPEPRDRAQPHRPRELRGHHRVPERQAQGRPGRRLALRQDHHRPGGGGGAAA